MGEAYLAIKSRKIITPGGVVEGAVLVRDGVISGIVATAEIPASAALEDASDLVVMPGLVDSHVHVNEPGRTEWEGFETATKAAAAGGITTIADMPLNSDPVTTTLSAFKEKLAAAAGKLSVDCAFYGGVVPGNVDSLQPLVEAGVVGFKCFLIHSGIDDFPNVEESDLALAMPVLARLGVPLLVHAELQRHEHDHEWGDPRSYMEYLRSRPRVWENDAIALMVDLCRKFRTRVHIVHLSSSDALPTVLRAHGEKLPFTAETCPHYLSFAAETIPDGDTRYKCAPPVREKENGQKLWQALKDGTLEFVVSDHSPCTPELKFLGEGDFRKAWGGISSVQFGLPIVWTIAQEMGVPLVEMSRWMCSNPAKFIGLGQRKGQIAAGFDADLIVFDPAEKFTLEQAMVHHRHKITPYEGRSLSGKVKTTYLRGRKIYENGTFLCDPSGKELLRQAVKTGTPG